MKHDQNNLFHDWEVNSSNVNDYPVSMNASSDEMQDSGLLLKQVSEHNR